MISCINEILDLMIKSSIVLGIIFLISFYIKINGIDKKIEGINKKFEIERNNRRGKGSGISEVIISGQIGELKKTKDEMVAPLERRRQRILSKIPFLKN